MNSQAGRWFPGTAAWLLAGLLASNPSWLARAEEQPAPPPKVEKDSDGADNGEQTKKGEKEKEKEREEFLRGALLETDSEVDRLLKRIQDDVKEERFGEAAAAAQHILNTCDKTLTTRDGRTYVAARDEAERLLASFPPEALKVYRLTADAEAKGLLGAPEENRDVESLQKVVDSLFLSSLGDDTAFVLGSLALDRGDYVKARGLFQKVLSLHPDPSMPREWLQARLILAQARSGCLPEARKAWDNLSTQGGERLPAALRAALSAALEKPEAAAQDDSTPSWGMSFGNPKRDGVAAALRPSALKGAESLWVVAWDRTFDLGPPKPLWDQGAPQPVNRELTVGRWERERLGPAEQLGYWEGRVYFKSHQSLICCDAKTGKVEWETRDQRPAENRPEKSRSGFSTGVRFGGDSSELEALCFRDQVGKALSLADGRVYHIENNYLTRNSRNMINYQKRRIVGVRPVATKPAVVQTDERKFALGTALACLDARSGKRLWGIGCTTDEKDFFYDLCFLDAPVPCGPHLLTPVTKEGELLLLALNPKDGAVAWKLFLSSSEGSRANPNNVVRIAVEGTEVFVAAANGLVFKVDGLEGKLLWATRYQRTFPQTAWGGGVAPRGCQDDFVCARGNRVIVVPLDAEAILALDRLSGQTVYRTDYAECRYVLGIRGDALFVAESKGVARIDLASGKKVWTTPAEPFGRGVVGERYVFVPARHKILVLDQQTGELAAVFQAHAPAGDPLGHLYLFDEEKTFFATGMEHVYALASAAGEFSELDRQIARAPSGELYLKRGRLHRLAGRFAPAIADLRKAHASLLDGPARAAAKAELLECICERARQAPEEAEQLIAEAKSLAQTPAERGKIALLQADVLAGRGRFAEALRIYSAAASGTDTHSRQFANGLSVPDAAWLEDADALSDLKAQIPLRAASALQRLLAQHGKALLTELEAPSREALKEALTNKDAAALHGVMRAYPGTAASIQAACEAAERARTAGDFEIGEQVLLALTRSSRRPTAASGAAALARYHEAQGWKDQAREEYLELKERFGDEALPGFDAGETAAGLAGKALASLGGTDASSLCSRMPDPPWRTRWSVKGEGLAFLTPGEGGRSEFLERHLLVNMGKDGRIACYDAATGKAAWSFAWPKDPPARTSSSIGFRVTMGGMVMSSSLGGSRPSLQRDAHLACLPTAQTLTVFGLVKGAKLWQKDLEWENASGRGFFGHMRNALLKNLDVGSGMVAQLVSDQKVRALDALTGSLLWERRFRRDLAGGVAVHEGCVLLNLQGEAGLRILDAYTGEVVGEISAGESMGYYQNAVAAPGGLLWSAYNPRKQESALEFHELPSGKLRWATEAEPVGQSLKVLDGKRLITGKQGAGAALKMRDLRTGKCLWEYAAGEGQANLSQLGLSEDGDLLLLRSTVTGEAGKASALVTLDADTGKLKGEADLGAWVDYYTQLCSDITAAKGGWIAVLEHRTTPQTTGGHTYNRPTYLWKVHFYRKSDGKEVAGLRLPGMTNEGVYDRLTPPILVLGGLLAVMQKDGLLAIEHSSAGIVPASSGTSAGR